MTALHKETYTMKQKNKKLFIKIKQQVIIIIIMIITLNEKNINICICNKFSQSIPCTVFTNNVYINKYITHTRIHVKLVYKIHLSDINLNKHCIIYLSNIIPFVQKVLSQYKKWTRLSEQTVYHGTYIRW